MCMESHTTDKYTVLYIVGYHYSGFNHAGICIYILCCLCHTSHLYISANLHYGTPTTYDNEEHGGIREETTLLVRFRLVVR